MEDSIATEARKLLQRREKPWGIWDYLRPNLVRKLIITVIIAAIAFGLHQGGAILCAGLIAGFWIGQVLRDLRWYAALSAKWPQTCQLIDWPKVEEMGESRRENEPSGLSG